jgi:glucoamylase
MWTFRHRTRRVAAGRNLRLILRATARVRWTTDNWRHEHDLDTAPAGFADLNFADLPLTQCAANTVVEWTFFWPESNHWEGENFRAEIA